MAVDESDAVTVLVADEETMHRAAECALKWLTLRPDHVPGTSYAFIVESEPDGRVAITGMPVEALPDLRRASIALEVRRDSVS